MEGEGGEGRRWRGGDVGKREEMERRRWREAQKGGDREDVEKGGDGRELEESGDGST